jgi:uncharacterized protein YggE
MNTTIAALNAVNLQIAALIRVIQSIGIPTDDYSTSSFSINQVYNYSNGLSILVGQKASQILTVKVRNLSNGLLTVGNLVSAASKINGLVVNSVNFDQSDHTIGVKQARQAAYNSAKAKADQYASLSNITLTGIRKI